VRSRFIPEQDWAQEAADRGLLTAMTVQFPSVIFSGDNSVLVTVKAVSAGYPLRGSMLVADEPWGKSRKAADVPPSGSVWVAPRIPGEIDTGVGKTIELGNLEVQIDATIALEPDRGTGVFDIAPRVMMNYADIGESGLIGEGSRIRHQLLISGAPAAIEQFREWLEPRLERGQYFRSLEDSQRQVSNALDRSGRFLRLAALTAVILAGIAIVLSVREFVQRHMDSVAIMRCLGARQRSVLLAFTLELVWIALPALVVGIIAGYLGQSVLVAAMGDLVPESLPAPGLLPALAALLTGLLALLGYGLPPLLALRQVPPARVLHRQFDQARPRQMLGYLAPVGFSIALIFWQAGEAALSLWITAGLAGTLLLLSSVALLIIRSLRRLSRGRGRGISWRFGLANVSRKGRGTMLQIAGLGLGLMVIFLLGVVQSDLLRGWQESLPEKTPNIFLINIQPQQTAAVSAHVQQTGIESQGLFPMATSRLSGINGAMPDPDDFTDQRAANRVRGTVNLSWAEDLPRANKIIAGEWWDPERGDHQVSLAQSWAEMFNLGIGETLSFAVGSDTLTATISSIREVDWDSFEANFFILLSPGAVDELPRTYISSMYVADDQFSAITDLVRSFPNISVIDTGSVLQRVRTIIQRVSLTVQLVYVFTVLAGLTMLLAALQGGIGERIYEGAVLRTLGGSRSQLRGAVISEFALMGGVAGFLAATAALIVGWLLAVRVFEIEYDPGLWLPLAGLLGGAAGIALTGLIGSRQVLKTPPAVILRKA
jgi:putative ABC transport system permease protein